MRALYLRRSEAEDSIIRSDENCILQPDPRWQRYPGTDHAVGRRRRSAPRARGYWSYEMSYACVESSMGEKHRQRAVRRTYVCAATNEDSGSCAKSSRDARRRSGAWCARRRAARRLKLWVAIIISVTLKHDAHDFGSRSATPSAGDRARISRPSSPCHASR